MEDWGKRTRRNDGHNVRSQLSWLIIASFPTNSSLMIFLVHQGSCSNSPVSLFWCFFSPYRWRLDYKWGYNISSPSAAFNFRPSGLNAAPPRPVTFWGHVTCLYMEDGWPGRHSTLWMPCPGSSPMQPNHISTLRPSGDQEGADSAEALNRRRYFSESCYHQERTKSQISAVSHEGFDSLE